MDFAEHKVINSSNVCPQLKNKKVFKIRTFQNFLNWYSLIADSLSIHEKKREQNITFPEKHLK